MWGEGIDRLIGEQRLLKSNKTGKVCMPALRFEGKCAVIESLILNGSIRLIAKTRFAVLLPTHRSLQRAYAAIRRPPLWNDCCDATIPSFASDALLAW